MRSQRCYLCLRRRTNARESLLEVPDQIVDRFNPDGEPNRPRIDTGGTKLLFIELPMRRARGMNDQAFRVADVSQMRPECDTTDEILPAGPPSCAVEGEDRTSSARQILVDERAVPARRHAGICDVRRKIV